MSEGRLWVTILAGGIGSRFWPLSTPARPKQLLPLASPSPLIVDTLSRARQVVPDARLRILTGADVARAIQRVSDLARDSFLLEPEAKGTGPVLFWAAWEIARRDPDAVIVSLHSDHVIRPTDAFVDLIRAGASVAAAADLLLTVAIPPDRPETGYGYIKPGVELQAPEGHRAYRVDSFVEKPDRDTAARYVEEGYRWNSGIFIWPAAAFVEEGKRHMHEIAPGIPALEDGDVEGFFGAVRSITVDEGVLERSDRVGSIDATFQWDDVGSWEALTRTREVDAAGNVSHGDAHLVDAKDSIAIADSGRLVLFGTEGLVVVQTAGVTMVVPRDRAPDLKRYLAELPEEVRRFTGGDEGPS